MRVQNLNMHNFLYDNLTSHWDSLCVATKTVAWAHSLSYQLFCALCTLHYMGTPSEPSKNVDIIGSLKVSRQSSVMNNYHIIIPSIVALLTC